MVLVLKADSNPLVPVRPQVLAQPVALLTVPLAAQELWGSTAPSWQRRKSALVPDTCITGCLVQVATCDNATSAVTALGRCAATDSEVTVTVPTLFFG
jgi:hypothetical protein